MRSPRRPASDIARSRSRTTGLRWHDPCRAGLPPARQLRQGSASLTFADAPMKKDRATRRDVLKTAMAASAAIFPMPAIAQQRVDRVVVVGGGFGGAACARALK